MSYTRNEYLKNVDSRRQVLEFLSFEEIRKTIIRLINEKDIALAKEISEDKWLWSLRALKDFGVPVEKFFKNISVDKPAIVVYSDYRTSKYVVDVLRDIWLFGRYTGILPDKTKAVEYLLDIKTKYHEASPKIRATLDDLSVYTFRYTGGSTNVGFVAKDPQIIEGIEQGITRQFIFDKSVKLMDIIRKFDNKRLPHLESDDGKTLWVSAMKLLEYMGYTLESHKKDFALTLRK